MVDELAIGWDSRNESYVGIDIDLGHITAYNWFGVCCAVVHILVPTISFIIIIIFTCPKSKINNIFKSFLANVCKPYFIFFFSWRSRCQLPKTTTKINKACNQFFKIVGTDHSINLCIVSRNKTWGLTLAVHISFTSIGLPIKQCTHTRPQTSTFASLNANAIILPAPVLFGIIAHICATHRVYVRLYTYLMAISKTGEKNKFTALNILIWYRAVAVCSTHSLNFQIVVYAI